MPRKVPSYRCYKPKNLGLVVINGKQHYLGPYGTAASLAEHHRLIQKSLTSSLTPAPGKAETLIGELILAFWEHAEKHYRSPDGKPTGELDNFRDALRSLRTSRPARIAVGAGQSGAMGRCSISLIWSQ